MSVRRLLALAAALVCAAVCAPGASGAPHLCDNIDIQGDPVSGGCMLPFPNDWFTKADPSTPTGRRLHFVAAAMPHNIAGKPIVPTDWNRADGFSPGSEIVVRVPGLDNEQAFHRTGAVPDTDIARYLDHDQPVVLIDAQTRKRWPIWSEVDESADDSPTANDNGRTFLIRPAKNLTEGHRYIVALRSLRDKDGNVLPAPPVFAAFRDNTPQSSPLDESRRAHFEDLFHTLSRAGIARQNLYLAWDFTVASRQSLTGRMLAIRNDAFHQLGDDNLRDLRVEGQAPKFTITRIVDQTCAVRKQITDATGGNADLYSPDLVIADANCDPGTNAQIVRDVKGTMTVPCYMSAPGCQPLHSHFVLGRGTDASPSGVPKQIPGNTMDVDFECRIPQSALDAGAGKSRPSLYGHGLFGDYGEVRQGQLQNFGNEDNLTFCATSWEGMATHDVPNVVTILTDLSYFNTLADRVQQGMLNFLLLGRLMIHPDGLCATAPFQTADGKCLLDTRRLFYDGNSQGGIIGGSLTAVAPDFTHATLGVPGMNYSTLLTRSSDFGTGKSYTPDPTNPDLPEYALPLYTAYPNRLDRQLIFSLMQILWDRAEPDGYAEHMTDHPLPDTPAHVVMMHAALGDHQVSNIAADVEARTIGAHLLRRPMIDPGRSADVTPFWGIPAWGSLPARGSTYVMWDSGTPVPPTTNTPNYAGNDPHEHPRNTRAARDMKSAFLAYDSRVIDTCGGGACYANGYHP